LELSCERKQGCLQGLGPHSYKIECPEQQIGKEKAQEPSLGPSYNRQMTDLLYFMYMSKIYNLINQER
jgi:hypothetical protein